LNRFLKIPSQRNDIFDSIQYSDASFDCRIRTIFEAP